MLRGVFDTKEVVGDGISIGLITLFPSLIQRPTQLVSLCIIFFRLAWILVFRIVFHTIFKHLHPRGSG